MAKLVDAMDSKSIGWINCAGSSPALGTKEALNTLIQSFFIFMAISKKNSENLSQSYNLKQSNYLKFVPESQFPYMQKQE